MMSQKTLPQDETALSEIAAVLKALGEPNRLRIFAELMKGDTCNAELNETLSLSPNLLSHHLRVLSDTGLVTSRRDRIDGRWIYYSVDREAAVRWQQWFAEFLDPARIRERVVCGPEGQVVELDHISVSADPAQSSR
jgi:ArsR family transcriptional regulator